MGKKKKRKKKGAKKQKQNSGQMNILGTEAGQLGTALVGAAVGEIVQAAIAKLSESAQTDGGSNQIGDSVKSAAATVKQSMVDGTPSVQAATGALKQVAEDLKPAVAHVINGVIDRVGNAKASVEGVAADTIDTAKETVQHYPGQGVVEDVQPAMTNVIDVVSDRTTETKQMAEATVIDTIDAAKKALKKAKSSKKKHKKA